MRGKRVALAFAIPIVFAIGSFVARVTVAHAPARLAPAFALPLAVANGFGRFGGILALELLATIALAGVIASVVVARAATTDLPFARARTLVIVASALAIAAAFSWPVVFSSDVNAYAAYGSEAARGLDPYTPGAQSIADPFVDAGRFIDRRDLPICVYGPAFVVLAESVVRATHGLAPALTIAVLRILASVTFLVSVLVLSYLTAPLPTPRRIAALALYALNPLAIWAVAEGHNDVYALIVTMLGVALALRARSFVGGLLIGLTALLKLPFAVAAVPLAAYLWGRGRRTQAVRLLGGAAIGVAVWGVSFLRVIGSEAEKATGDHRPSIVVLATLAPAALAIVAVVVFAFRALLRGDVRGFVWLGAALFLSAFPSWPWYALWILPLTAIPSGIFGIALWASSLLVTYRYYFDATTPTTIHLSQVNTVAKLMPFAAAGLYLAWRRARLQRS